MISLIKTILEIKFINHVTDKMIWLLSNKIYGNIENFWDEDNQDAMEDLDTNFSILCQKYRIDDLDGISKNDLEQANLSDSEKTEFYKELLDFKKANNL